MKGSLETRFFDEDYSDVLKTCVIEEVKKSAVQSGLRQLIDDTTTGVLILQVGNSVQCWLTGIPSSREDYMHTKIRYAIALQDEPGKMREWAGILCGLYSDQEQMQSLGKFLDGFIEDERSVKPSLTLDEIAAFLKSKIQPVQTDGIGVGCEFVLASYLAESQDSISSTISKVRNAPDTGVFWNGSGFSEVSHNSKKKRQTLAAKISSSTKPKHVPMVSNQVSNQTSSMESKHSEKNSEYSEKNSDRLLGYAKTLMIAGSTTFLILIIGMGVTLTKVWELSSSLDTLKKNYDSLQDTVEKQKNSLKDLPDKVDTLDKRVDSLEKERQKPKAQDNKNENQPPKKDKADKPAATQKK